jgi:acetolactate synthase-1/2/3 large subunit
MTLMGLGAYPGDDELSLDMLGMHGSVYSNYAVESCDLLLAFGVRFDDRVTGKLAEFAKHAVIVHIDIDPSELHKNKPAYRYYQRHQIRAAELNKVVEAPDRRSRGSSNWPNGRRTTRISTTSRSPASRPNTRLASSNA